MWRELPIRLRIKLDKHDMYCCYVRGKRTVKLTRCRELPIRQ